MDRAELEAVLDFVVDPPADFLAVDADLDFVLEELRPFPVVLAVDERPPADFDAALLAEELPPVFLLELDEVVLLPVFLAPVDDLLADDAPLLFADDLDAVDPVFLAVLLLAPELLVVEPLELDGLALLPAVDPLLPAEEPLLVDDEPLLLAVDLLLPDVDPLLPPDVPDVFRLVPDELPDDLLPAADDRLFVEPEVAPRVAIDEVSPTAALTAELAAPATAPVAAPSTISPTTSLALSRIVSSDPLFFDFLVAMLFPLFFFSRNRSTKNTTDRFPVFAHSLLTGQFQNPFQGIHHITNNTSQRMSDVIQSRARQTVSSFRVAVANRIGTKSCCSNYDSAIQLAHLFLISTIVLLGSIFEGVH